MGVIDLKDSHQKITLENQKFSNEFRELELNEEFLKEKFHTQVESLEENNLRLHERNTSLKIENFIIKESLDKI